MLGPPAILCFAVCLSPMMSAPARAGCRHMCGTLGMPQAAGASIDPAPMARRACMHAGAKGRGQHLCRHPLHAQRLEAAQECRVAPSHAADALVRRPAAMLRCCMGLSAPHASPQICIRCMCACMEPKACKISPARVSKHGQGTLNACMRATCPLPAYCVLASWPTSRLQPARGGWLLVAGAGSRTGRCRHARVWWGILNAAPERRECSVVVVQPSSLCCRTETRSAPPPSCM